MSDLESTNNLISQDDQMRASVHTVNLIKMDQNGFKNRRISEQYPTMGDLKRTGKEYFKSKTYTNHQFNTSLGKKEENGDSEQSKTNKIRESTGRLRFCLIQKKL